MEKVLHLDIMLALEILSTRGIVAASKALKFANQNDLVPMVSFYLEEDLIDRVMKKHRGTLEKFYKEWSFEKTFFVRKTLDVLKRKEIPSMSFAYYATPLSNAEVIVYENNQIPTKVIPLNGRYRLTFMSYTSLNELEKTVKEGNEDDVIAEFQQGKLTKLERRRVVFMELKSIDQLSNYTGTVVINFAPTYPTFLIMPLIAMNVYPGENKVAIDLGGEDEITYRILNGKAPQSDVLDGSTLTPRGLAELYYDWRSKKISRELEIQGLTARLPS